MEVKLVLNRYILNETLFFTAVVLLCVQNKCLFFCRKKPDWFDQIEIKKR